MADSGQEVEKTRYEKFEEGMRAFCKFLYNKESGEVMGRNGASWAKIGIFYVIFYGCLAAFFGIVMAVFLSTLNKPGEGGPKLTQYIKNRPGLSVAVSIGNFNESDINTYEPFAQNILTFLDQYRADGYSNETCPLDNLSGYAGTEPCRFNFTLLEACSGETDKSFGMRDGKPCIFIRMNKVFDWVPSSDGSPFVTLKCNGEVDVFPTGFLISAFPYRGQSFYRTPPVAVQARKRGQSIQCRLTGKDIEESDSFNKMKSFGNVEFSV